MGGGNLSKELLRLGYDVVSSDLYDRGYGLSDVNFLECHKEFDGNILTNPPYNQLNEFILKGLELASDKLYIFARIQALESISRWNNIFRFHKPILVCPFVKRIPCYHSGKTKKYSSAICYAWFIWDNKKENNFTEIKWLI